jgi:hypothetical protein
MMLNHAYAIPQIMGKNIHMAVFLNDNTPVTQNGPHPLKDTGSSL